MNITTEHANGIAVVRVGESRLMYPLLSEFSAAVQKLIASGEKRVVVDLSAVPYLDSKGLEALVEVTEEMGRSGQALRMCGANKTVREVLELTDLASHFEHFQDANTAVRSFL